MSQAAKKCDGCGSKLVETTENRRYDRSGLPNVVLMGVTVEHCRKCATSEMLIPRMDALHDLIANAVIHKESRLAPAEIAFLRHFMGWTGVSMGQHMGVDPTTVSAWENGRKTIGPASDRLLRLIVAKRSKSYEYEIDDLVDISDEQRPPERVDVRPRANGWQLSVSP